MRESRPERVQPRNQQSRLHAFALMQPLQVKIRHPAATPRISSLILEMLWSCHDLRSRESSRSGTRPFCKPSCRSCCAILENGGGAASAPSAITTFLNAQVITGSDAVNDVQQAGRLCLAVTTVCLTSRFRAWWTPEGRCASVQV